MGILSLSHSFLISLVIQHNFEILVRRRRSTGPFSHFHGYLEMRYEEVVEKKHGPYIKPYPFGPVIFCRMC